MIPTAIWQAVFAPILIGVLAMVILQVASDLRLWLRPKKK